MGERKNIDIAFLLGGGLIGAWLANFPEDLPVHLMGAAGLVLVLGVMLQRHLDSLPARVLVGRWAALDEPRFSELGIEFDLYPKRAVRRGIWVICDTEIKGCRIRVRQRREDGSPIEGTPATRSGEKRVFAWIENAGSAAILKTKISVTLHSAPESPAKVIRVRPVRWWERWPLPRNLDEIKRLSP